jgi:hypothetical protein
MVRSKLIIVISLILLVSVSGVVAMSKVTGKATEVVLGNCRDTDGDDPYTPGALVQVSGDVKRSDLLDERRVDECKTKRVAGQLQTVLEEGKCVGRGLNPNVGQRTVRDYVVNNLGPGYCDTQEIQVELTLPNGRKEMRNVRAAYWKRETCSTSDANGVDLGDGVVDYQGNRKIPECRGNRLVKFDCKPDTTLKEVVTSCASDEVCQQSACKKTTEVAIQGSTLVQSLQNELNALRIRFNSLQTVLCQKDLAYCGI